MNDDLTHEPTGTDNGEDKDVEETVEITQTGRQTPAVKKTFRPRTGVAIGVLAVLLIAWGVSAYQMRALKPSLAQEAEPLERACEKLFADAEVATNAHEIVRKVSVRREFLLFGAPHGYVSVTARFTDRDGTKHNVTERHEYLWENGSWELSPIVYGDDLAQQITFALYGKDALPGPAMQKRPRE